ncbi:MAG: hypothetical protein LQ346_003493 [Caloplaca aetnensis]|nr:MAG: hypothetical protein LQ346_003493 [Caloplaca aetnensis]
MRPLNTSSTTLFLALLAFLSFALAYSGDMTYHIVSQSRTCGTNYNNKGNWDPVVALSREMMKSRLHKCGTWIGIWNPATKKKWNAMITDTCSRCLKYDISVGAHLFANITNGYFPEHWPTGGRYDYGAVRVDWGGAAVGG